MNYDNIEDLWAGEKLSYFKVPLIEGLDMSIAPTFMSIRIYRSHSNTEMPRLYRLLGNYKHREIQKSHYLIFESLNMAWVGAPSVERIFDVLIALPGENALLSRLYQQARARHINRYKVTGKKAPAFAKSPKKWFFSQWEIYEDYAVDLLLDAPPQAFSVRCDIACLSYINMKKVVAHKGEDYPSWKNFMSQMDPEDAETFAAYIFSIFDVKSVSKQLVYLWDEGNTGKSTVTNALNKALGDTVCTAISKTIGTNDFGTSLIYGKRLIVYPECKDLDVLKSSIMHSITGGDTIQINTKFQSMFSAQVYAKIIVCSNDTPDVDLYQKNQKTRIIPIRLEAGKCISTEHYNAEGVFLGNPNFEGELRKDFWAFVWYAFECYQKLCDNHGQITVREEAYTTVVGQNQTDSEQIIEDFIEITGNGEDYIALRDLNFILEEHFRHDHKKKYLKRDFRRLIESQGASWGKRLTVDDKRIRVCTGVKKKAQKAYTGGDVNVFGF